MDNKIDRLKNFIINSNTPIYVDKNIFDKYIFEKNSTFINANCMDNELFGTDSKPNWLVKLEEQKDEDISILEINFDNTSIEEQKRFISIIKDRAFMSYKIPDNVKIVIYSSSMDKIYNELMGLLVVI